MPALPWCRASATWCIMCGPTWSCPRSNAWRRGADPRAAVSHGPRQLADGAEPAVGLLDLVAGIARRLAPVCARRVQHDAAVDRLHAGRRHHDVVAEAEGRTRDD